MWTYSQGTGKLFDPAGVHVATGYSGKGKGKNNCDMQHVKNVGPIPRGLYTIGQAYNSQKVGPFALPLTPDPSNEMFGRSAFLCHGESSKNPGNASEGCIILKRSIRNLIWDSGDRVLLVVS
jgi:hypothetical protein